MPFPVSADRQLPDHLGSGKDSDSLSIAETASEHWAERAYRAGIASGPRTLDTSPLLNVTDRLSRRRLWGGAGCITSRIHRHEQCTRRHAF